jgi:hypothetical protein
MFRVNVVKKIKKTRFLWSIMFLRKFCRLRDSVEKYCRAGQNTWQCNMAHEHCMLGKIRTREACISADPRVHIHCARARTHASMYTRIRMHAVTRTHPRARTRTEICNIYCFFAAKMVTRIRLNVTMHVHCSLLCYCL